MKLLKFKFFIFLLFFAFIGESKPYTHNYEFTEYDLQAFYSKFQLSDISPITSFGTNNQDNHPRFKIKTGPLPLRAVYQKFLISMN